MMMILLSYWGPLLVHNMCLVRPALLYLSVHVLKAFYGQINYYYYYYYYYYYIRGRLSSGIEDGNLEWPWMTFNSTIFDSCRGQLRRSWLKVDPNCRRQECSPPYSSALYDSCWYSLRLRRKSAKRAGPHSTAKIRFMQHSKIMAALL